MKPTKKNIALIPARSGSKRLPHKNIKLLRGVPLIAYSIFAAEKSQLFSEIIVSTDSEETAQIARRWGARVPLLRPSKFANDTSPDIDWLLHAIRYMVESPKSEIEFVAILRPTSPLRSSVSIVEVMQKLRQNSWADSARAMEITNKHPGKMWIVDNKDHAVPFLDQHERLTPTHDSPTQTLEELWVQNASLEIVRLSSLLKYKTLTGPNVLKVELPEFESHDINSFLDWEFLEFLIAKYPELLPSLNDSKVT